MSSVLAVASSLVGALATLLMLTLLLASAPNSTPQQLSQINWLMLAVGLIGLAGLAAAVVALIAGRQWLAAGAGLAPAAFSVIILTVLLITER